MLQRRHTSLTLLVTWCVLLNCLAFLKALSKTLDENLPTLRLNLPTCHVEYKRGNDSQPHGKQINTQLVAYTAAAGVMFFLPKTSFFTEWSRIAARFFIGEIRPCGSMHLIFFWVCYSAVSFGAIRCRFEDENRTVCG